MKRVVLNENLNGFEYCIYSLTEEEYKYFLTCIDKEVITISKYDIVKLDIRKYGKIPAKYPFKNKNIIPHTYFRNIGSNIKDNHFTKSYFCYLLNKFGNPTLIQHEDIESAWKCLVYYLHNPKIIITKTKINNNYGEDEKSDVSEEI